MDLTLIQMVHAAKTAFSDATGLGSDACHVHIGLVVFFTVVVLHRRFRSAVWPWLVCLMVAVAGELIDRADDMQRIGAWRWWESRHDLINTMFWPTVLVFVERVRRRRAFRMR